MNKRISAVLTLAAFSYSVYRAWPRLKRAVQDLIASSEPRSA